MNNPAEPPPTRSAESVELEVAMIKAGKLRPASLADWQHALAVVGLSGVVVHVHLTMRQGMPWEITYQRDNGAA